MLAGPCLYLIDFLLIGLEKSNSHYSKTNEVNRKEVFEAAAHFIKSEFYY